MEKKFKKKMVITQKEHDAWHKKQGDLEWKSDKEHEICHRKMGIVVKGK
jgi:hypothetical protein